LDFATDKEAFFGEVREAVLGAHGPAAQRSGLALLEALVSEFSPSTASAMGLPAEFHEHCRASLELDYLQVMSVSLLSSSPVKWVMVTNVKYHKVT
jgi:hypothetical protein